MTIIRGVKDRRFKFVQLLNSMFEDTTLSLKAKGFIGYCLTNKQDWELRISHMSSVLKEGEDAIYSVINECIKNGYAYRHRSRDEKGQIKAIEFFISDSKTEIQEIIKELELEKEIKKSLPHRENPEVDPIPQNPDRENPRRENPEVDNSSEFPRRNENPIYNNTIENNTNIRKEQQQYARDARVDDVDFSFTKEEEDKLKEFSLEQIREAKETTNNQCIQKKSQSRISFFFKVLEGLKIKAYSKKKTPEECQRTIEEKNKQEAQKILKIWKKPENIEKARVQFDYADSIKIDLQGFKIDIYDGKKYRTDASLILKYSEKGFIQQLENFFRKQGFTKQQE